MSYTPNLGKLFECDDNYLMTALGDGLSGRQLQIVRDAIYQYREAVDKISSELNCPEGRAPSLSYAVNEHWPAITLEQAREKRVHDNCISREYGYLREPEVSYGSGFTNAAVLFLNPSSYSHEVNYESPAISIKGWLWDVSKGLIRARRTILSRGKIVPDPVDALGQYLYAVERKIDEDVAKLEGDTMVPQTLFWIGPHAGLSLVGFGDALRKAAQAEPSREREVLEMALRSYGSSGFDETLYVQNRRLEIGDLSPRLYVVVPASKLKAMVSEGQFDELTKGD